MKDQFARFKVFVNWLSCTQNSEDSTFKKEIMELFDLNEFTCNQLTTCVRQSLLYSVEEIFNVLGTKAVSMEKSLEKGKSVVEDEEEESFVKFLENISVGWKKSMAWGRKEFEAKKRTTGN